MYFGSMWKDFGVWQAAPHIAHRLGCVNAWALEFDNASHGTSIALRIARGLLRAEPELRNGLMVAASRESELIDFAHETTRFAFNFDDGAVAALLAGEPERNEVLGAHTITDGAYSLHVKVPGGGSSDKTGYRLLDVSDGAAMKEGLVRESLPNFVHTWAASIVRWGPVA